MFPPSRFQRRTSVAAIAALIAVHSALASWVVSVAGNVQTRLIYPLAARFEPPALDPSANLSGIIVLGGGFERTREGVRLTRLHPEALLVITGASDQDYTYARKYAADPSRVVIEPNAKSTFDNARYTRRLLAPKPGENWLLVTSAAHMPRAVATFRGVDFPVLPWPVHDEPSQGDTASVQATHEYLGLIGYRLMGRTREFWPSLTSATPPGRWQSSRPGTAYVRARAAAAGT